MGAVTDSQLLFGVAGWSYEDWKGIVYPRNCKDTLRAVAVLNVADAQGRDNDEATAALAAIDGIEALPVAIVRRKAFPNAFSAGLSVLEQAQRDPKACSEITSLVNSLYTHEVDNGYQDAAKG